MLSIVNSLKFVFWLLYWVGSVFSFLQSLLNLFRGYLFGWAASALLYPLGYLLGCQLLYWAAKFAHV